MKIDIHVGQLLDDIYADSALKAIATRNDRAAIAPLLTPDHRDALRRVIIHAAGIVAAGLKRRLLAFSYPDPADPSDTAPISFTVTDLTSAVAEALHIHFSNAVTFACFHLLRLTYTDSKGADTYRICLDQTISTISHCLDNITSLPRLRRCYY